MEQAVKKALEILTKFIHDEGIMRGQRLKVHVVACTNVLLPCSVSAILVE